MGDAWPMRGVDDTRQEAIERAETRLRSQGIEPWKMHGGSGGHLYEGSCAVCRGRVAILAEQAIDASGLIEQLTEAIAQRDDALTGLRNAVIRSSEAREQLAAERALCDRLAAAYRAKLTGPAFQSHWLGDYDAHRASERET